MNSSKAAVRLIADVCLGMGIRYAVFSPGSRSAPLVIAFSNIEEIECMVIPDERVAGYFALGLAQHTGEPVAVICTSGTAVLNLGPALCEAYYQHVPLLFLTADRPAGAEEKGENQAIKQAFLFKEFTTQSLDIYGDVITENELAALQGQLESAIYSTTQPVPGPAHINIRLSEPLYVMDKAGYVPPQVFEPLTPAPVNQPVTSRSGVDLLNAQLAETNKRLVIVGMLGGHNQLASTLQILATHGDVVVFTETLSNSGHITSAITNYDACIDLIADEQLKDFTPELVITFGNQVISKKVRQFLKANKPRYHWDISPYNEHRRFGIFDIETNRAALNEADALKCLAAAPKQQTSFATRWQALHKKAGDLTAQYLNDVPFSDLKVFEALSKSYPEKAYVQYGNSTPIRYSNFFAHQASLRINANRGASGIDGPVSTAAGAAWASKDLTICVVGDVSFFYDSNALWNNYLSPAFRIIVINNAGGNIFRLLNGPTQVKEFEKFFETTHHLSAQHLAEMYGLHYYFCLNQAELSETLRTFYQPQKNNKPAILEIKTDGVVSAGVYSGYFEMLKQNKNN